MISSQKTSLFLVIILLLNGRCPRVTQESFAFLPRVLRSPPKPRLTKKDLVRSLSRQIEQDKGVWFLDRLEARAATETLADAFRKDPLIKWITGLDGSGPEDEKKIFKYSTWVAETFNSGISSFLEHRDIHLGVRDGPNLKGVMVVTLPSLPNIFDASMVLLSRRNPLLGEGYGPHSYERFECIANIGEKIYQEFLEEYPDYITIGMVGVRYDLQGKGIGGRMFRPVFKAADSLGVPVFLGTTSTKNEAMYKHYGFETKETVEMAAKGDTSKDAKFKIYFMLRMPK